MLPGKGEDAVVELTEVDAGSKARAVIMLQPDGLPGGDVQEFHIPLLRHGLQDFSYVPVVP